MCTHPGIYLVRVTSCPPPVHRLPTKRGHTSIPPMHLIPATLPLPLTQVPIKAAKVRGVESCGMLCGMGELGLLSKGEAATKEVGPKPNPKP